MFPLMLIFPGMNAVPSISASGDMITGIPLALLMSSAAVDRLCLPGTLNVMFPIEAGSMALFTKGTDFCVNRRLLSSDTKGTVFCGCRIKFCAVAVRSFVSSCPSLTTGSKVLLHPDTSIKMAVNVVSLKGAWAEWMFMILVGHQPFGVCMYLTIRTMREFGCSTACNG